VIKLVVRGPRLERFEALLQNAGKEMALELKNVCEECGAALTPGGMAYICSYECTYCESCGRQLKFICPNCKGELVRRPRREEPSISGEPAGA
jgi:hypothetical protein